jgi:DNA-binding MarR family transcriptional regulator
MFYASDPDTDFNGTADELASRSADDPDAPGAPASQDTPDERELQVLSHVHAVVDQRRDQRSSSANATGTSSGTASAAGPADAGGTGEEHTAAAHISQRSIAQALGMSAGPTNAILKRLTDKGFLMMRRINAHNVHYLVTPEGIEQISRRSYLYLRRTIGHVVRYKERLREFCREQQHAGVREIVLIGESDLSFILEWCAEKEELRFRHLESVEDRDAIATAHRHTLRVLSERYLEPPETSPHADAVLLHRIVLGLTQRERSGTTDTVQS